VQGACRGGVSLKFGRELRVEGAYTVSEVARLLGISPVTVRAWRLGGVGLGLLSSSTTST